MHTYEHTRSCWVRQSAGPPGRPDAKGDCNERTATIDGRAAELTTCTVVENQRYTASLYIDPERAAGLTMVAKCKDAAGPIEAHALFRSIHF